MTAKGNQETWNLHDKQNLQWLQALAKLDTSVAGNSAAAGRTAENQSTARQAESGAEHFGTEDGRPAGSAGPV